MLRPSALNFPEPVFELGEARRCISSRGFGAVLGSGDLNRALPLWNMLRYLVSGPFGFDAPADGACGGGLLVDEEATSFTLVRVKYDELRRFWSCTVGVDGVE